MACNALDVHRRGEEVNSCKFIVVSGERKEGGDSLRTRLKVGRFAGLKVAELKKRSGLRV
jgi:hypothetical protein